MPAPRFETPVTLESLLAAAEGAYVDDTQRALLVFECGGALSALPAASVVAIDEAGIIAPLPYPPPDVLGVASVRGRMRLVVRPGGSTPTGRGRLISLLSDGNLAIHVDRVIGVVSFDLGDSEAHSATLQTGGLDVNLVDPAAFPGISS